jgi:hypothetical protein
MRSDEIFAEVNMKQRICFSEFANTCEQFARRLGQRLRW